MRFKNLSSVIIVLRFFKYLSKKRRIKIFLLLCLMTLNGILEIITFASLVPFIQLVISPNKISQIYFLNNFFDININNSDFTTYFFAAIFSIFVILSGLIRTYSLKTILNTSRLIGEDLGRLAFKKSIYLPYEDFIKTKSSDLITIINTFQDSVVTSISSLLTIVSCSLILTSISLSLLLINWKIIIISLVGIFSSYLVIAIFFSKKLKKVSIDSANSSKAQVKIIQQSFNSIKSIIIDNLYEFYYRLFIKANHLYRQSFMNTIFYTAAPRYLIESLSLTTIMAATVLLIHFGTSKVEIITLLGVIALAAQKILPSMQQIYGSWTTINALKESLISFQDILKFPSNPIVDDASQVNNALKNKIFDIELKNISFKYKSNDNYLLRNINLKIKPGSRIGIIGETGSGKSSFLNIIMSLIKPTNGKVEVNGKDIFNKKNRKYLIGWRELISHVPQDISLIDGSITENIALGISKKNLDKDKLRQTANYARLTNYIRSKRNGFNTNIGEQGINISGGQKQRIAIARALYKKSKVIFLDEATSALDKKTEKEVMDLIYSLEKSITIFIISHNIETLNRCDQVFKIENGSLILVP